MFPENNEGHAISIPSPLLESIFSNNDTIFNDFSDYSEVLKKLQIQTKEILRKDNRIKSCLDAESPDLNSIAGVDGTYAVKKAVAADLYVVASVLLGANVMKANSETFVLPPSEHSTRIAQGIMTILEIASMQESEEEMTFYDGSFLVPIIKLNSMYSDYNKHELKNEINNTRIKTIMDDFRYEQGLKEIIDNKKTFAIPKESSSSTFSSKILNNLEEDVKYRVVDKILLSGVLNEGDYIIDSFESEGLHLPIDSDKDMYFSYGKEIINAMKTLKVMYIKPKSWVPTQRVEFPGTLSNSEVEVLARTITELFNHPSVMEPYPLFITDRICKSISQPADAVIATILSKLSSDGGSGFSNEELQWILRSYRTEV